MQWNLYINICYININNNNCVAVSVPHFEKVNCIPFLFHLSILDGIDECQSYSYYNCNHSQLNISIIIIVVVVLIMFESIWLVYRYIIYFWSQNANQSVLFSIRFLAKIKSNHCSPQYIYIYICMNMPYISGTLTHADRQNTHKSMSC